jgi:hypothetical protein
MESARCKEVKNKTWKEYGNLNDYIWEELK